MYLSVTSRNADAFGYNARFEVTSAVIHAGSTNRYAYDGIGNALWSSLNAATNTYTANSLNQYTNIANGSTVEPEYDLDGNLTCDDQFGYAWDAENRLTAVYSNNLCIVSNAYDHMSRRVLKITPTATHTFVYDGWNLAQEIIATASGVTTNRYIWGKDLSGTLQGAGGVCGLLAVSLNGSWYFPLYDNNGNVTAYVDESGALVAEYTYDAFGRLITQSGPLADAFPHRFSTKYYDPETGLYYYGYRYYAPELGRWLNRDPIGERGGINLCAFNRNAPVGAADYLGLMRLQLIFEYIPEKTEKTEYNPPDTTYVKTAAGMVQRAKDAVGEKYNPKSGDCEDCGNCIETLVLSNHGVALGEGGNIDLGGSEKDKIIYYPDKYEEILRKQARQEPLTRLQKRVVEARQALESVAALMCDNGKFYVLVCGAGAGEGGKLLREHLQQMVGPGVTIVTYSGTCGFYEDGSWGLGGSRWIGIFEKAQCSGVRK